MSTRSFDYGSLQWVVSLDMITRIARHFDLSEFTHHHSICSENWWIRANSFPSVKSHQNEDTKGRGWILSETVGILSIVSAGGRRKWTTGRIPPFSRIRALKTGWHSQVHNAQHLVVKREPELGKKRNLFAWHLIFKKKQTNLLKLIGECVLFS